MSVKISQMFEGFGPNEIEHIKQAHQTYFEVMGSCMSDNCVEPGPYHDWLEQFIARHDDVQAMLQVMLDRFEYREDDLDYTIDINDWTLCKHDMYEACIDQYEVWTSLVDDEVWSEERFDMLDKIHWLSKSIDKLHKAI